MVLPYCSFLEREESRNQAPLYPPLQRAGGQVVGFIEGPLSFYSGPGGFHRLRQKQNIFMVQMENLLRQTPMIMTLRIQAKKHYLRK